MDDVAAIAIKGAMFNRSWWVSVVASRRSIPGPRPPGFAPEPVEHPNGPKGNDESHWGGVTGGGLNDAPGRRVEEVELPTGVRRVARKRSLPEHVEAVGA